MIDLVAATPTPAHHRSMTADPSSIAVIIPAFRVAPQVREVIARIPAHVRHIVVVNDASPDDLAAVLQSIADPRVVAIAHERNRGVGGAMKTGFAKACDLGADIIVKV